jgi:hypothetical protein
MPDPRYAAGARTNTGRTARRPTAASRPVLRRAAGRQFRQPHPADQRARDVPTRKLRSRTDWRNASHRLIDADDYRPSAPRLRLRPAADRRRLAPDISTQFTEGAHMRRSCWLPVRQLRGVPWRLRRRSRCRRARLHAAHYFEDDDGERWRSDRRAGTSGCQSARRRRGHHSHTGMASDGLRIRQRAGGIFVRQSAIVPGRQAPDCPRQRRLRARTTGLATAFVATNPASAIWIGGNQYRSPTRAS